MSHLEVVLQEIPALDEQELKIVLAEVSRRLGKKDQALNVLRKYRGRGKGVWAEDAQEHVNKLREHDRG